MSYTIDVKTDPSPNSSRYSPDDCSAVHDDRNTTTSGSILRYLDIRWVAQGVWGQMRVVVVDSDQGHKTKGLMSWSKQL